MRLKQQQQQGVVDWSGGADTTDPSRSSINNPVINNNNTTDHNRNNSIVHCPICIIGIGLLSTIVDAHLLHIDLASIHVSHHGRSESRGIFCHGKHHTQLLSFDGYFGRCCMALCLDGLSSDSFCGYLVAARLRHIVPSCDFFVRNSSTPRFLDLAKPHGTIV
jgi:hypothetical protein